MDDARVRQLLREGLDCFRSREYAGARRCWAELLDQADLPLDVRREVIAIRLRLPSEHQRAGDTQAFLEEASALQSGAARREGTSAHEASPDTTSREEIALLLREYRAIAGAGTQANVRPAGEAEPDAVEADGAGGPEAELGAWLKEEQARSATAARAAADFDPAADTSVGSFGLPRPGAAGEETLREADAEADETGPPPPAPESVRADDASEPDRAASTTATSCAGWPPAARDTGIARAGESAPAVKKDDASPKGPSWSAGLSPHMPTPAADEISLAETKLRDRDEVKARMAADSRDTIRDELAPLDAATGAEEPAERLTDAEETAVPGEAVSFSSDRGHTRSDDTVVDRPSESSLRIESAFDEAERAAMGTGDVDSEAPTDDAIPSVRERLTESFSCSACGAVNLAGSLFCGHCRHPLRRESSPASAEEAERLRKRVGPPEGAGLAADPATLTGEAAVSCPVCHYRNLPDGRFCSWCGAVLIGKTRLDLPTVLSGSSMLYALGYAGAGTDDYLACTSCGYDSNHEDATYCGNCGKVLPGKVSHAPPSEEESLESMLAPALVLELDEATPDIEEGFRQTTDLESRFDITRRPDVYDEGAPMVVEADDDTARRRSTISFAMHGSTRPPETRAVRTPTEPPAEAEEDVAADESEELDDGAMVLEQADAGTGESPSIDAEPADAGQPEASTSTERIRQESIPTPPPGEITLESLAREAADSIADVAHPAFAAAVAAAKLREAGGMSPPRTAGLESTEIDYRATSGLRRRAALGAPASSTGFAWPSDVRPEVVEAAREGWMVYAKTYHAEPPLRACVKCERLVDLERSRAQFGPFGPTIRQHVPDVLGARRRGPRTWRTPMPGLGGLRCNACGSPLWPAATYQAFTRLSTLDPDAPDLLHRPSIAQRLLGRVAGWVLRCAVPDAEWRIVLAHAITPREAKVYLLLTVVTLGLWLPLLLLPLAWVAWRRFGPALRLWRATVQELEVKAVLDAAGISDDDDEATSALRDARPASDLSVNAPANCDDFGGEGPSGDGHPASFALDDSFDLDAESAG